MDAFLLYEFNYLQIRPDGTGVGLHILPEQNFLLANETMKFCTDAIELMANFQCSLF